MRAKMVGDCKVGQIIINNRHGQSCGFFWASDVAEGGCWHISFACSDEHLH